MNMEMASLLQMASSVKCRRQLTNISFLVKYTILVSLISSFILVNASPAEAVEEPRRCYWCGPLAEQVHRSARAPACAGAAADQAARCEPGQRHCAVVATAPPYVESRLCVKMYQDECYTVYCNTTNTWKVTCPCRGDLCNGPNSQRETDAFVVLSKLVVKIKKRFIQESNENTGIVNNATADNQLSAKDNKEGNAEITNKDVMKNVKPTETESVQDNNMMHSNEIKGIEDAKVEIHIPEDTKIAPKDEIEMPQVAINIPDDTKTAPKDEIDKIEMPVAIDLTTVEIAIHEPIKTIITIMNDERQSVSNVKGTERMPAAESLQQGANAEVEENPTEATTVELATMAMPMTTNADMPMEATGKPKNGKNTSGKISCNIIDVMLSLVVVKFTV